MKGERQIQGEISKLGGEVFGDLSWVWALGLPQSSAHTRFILARNLIKLRSRMSPKEIIFYSCIKLFWLWSDRDQHVVSGFSLWLLFFQPLPTMSCTFLPSSRCCHMLIKLQDVCGLRAVSLVTLNGWIISQTQSPDGRWGKSGSSACSKNIKNNLFDNKRR